MTSSPDLIHELRASRPSAPAELRARVREIAAEQPARAPWASWRSRSAAVLLIAVPAAAALAFASAGVLGLARSDVSPTEALQQQESLATDSAAGKTGELAPTDYAPTRIQSDDRPTTDRAQRVSATLTIEVADRRCRFARSTGRSRPHPHARRLRRLVVGGHGRRGKRVDHRPRPGRRKCRMPSQASPVSGASSRSRSPSTTCRQTLDELERREAPCGARSRASSHGSSRIRSTRRPKRCSEPACRRFAASCAEQGTASPRPKRRRGCRRSSSPS